MLVVGDQRRVLAWLKVPCDSDDAVNSLGQGLDTEHQVQLERTGWSAHVSLALDRTQRAQAVERSWQDRQQERCSESASRQSVGVLNAHLRGNSLNSSGRHRQ